MELPRIIQSIFADPAEKARRLSICATCPYLTDFAGQKTCGICGCFVEVKAGLTKYHCPLATPKW